MQVLPSFDPSLVMNGKINVSSVDPGSKILLYNLSIYTLQLNFDNGDSALIHAGEANYWVLDGSTTTIDWIQYSKLNALTPASSVVTATVYRSDEEIVGTYPMALTYNVVVGNTVTTSQGATLTVTNDGSALGTVFVESTAVGQSSSSVSLTVDGLLKLATVISGTLVQLIKTQNTGNPLLLGALATITEILGNLTVDGNAVITGTLNTGTITATNGVTVIGGDFTAGVHNYISSGNVQAGSVQTNTMNDSGGSSWAAITPGSVTRIGSPTGGTVVLQVNGQTIIAVVTGGSSITGTLGVSGLISANAGVNLISGKVSRNARMTAQALTVGQNTVVHNLGWTPQVINVIATSANSSATVGWNAATSTQVIITVGATLNYDITFWGF